MVIDKRFMVNSMNPGKIIYPAGLLSLLLVILVSPLSGIAYAASTATSTTSPITTTQSSSQDTVQLSIESINNTFSIIISKLKEQGYNTTQLEQTVSQMIQAIQSGNYALGRSLFIKAVDYVYKLEAGTLIYNQTELMLRVQQQIQNRIAELNQSISNMTFLSSEVRTNLTQMLQQASQLLQSGNYSGAAMLMERVMVQLREMSNALNRERVMTMLTTMAIERANEINNLSGRQIIDERKLELNESEITKLALKVRGLGMIEREVKGSFANMNISWVLNTSDEDVFKHQMGDVMIGKAKELPEMFFVTSSVLLRTAEASLERTGKMNKDMQSYIQSLQDMIQQEKAIINQSISAATGLMEGNASSISIINQSITQAQQLLSQVNNMKVPQQLQNVKALIVNSLQQLIRELTSLQRISTSLEMLSKNVLLKGIVLEINGNNLTVLGVISPGSLVMGGYMNGIYNKQSIVMLPTNWTIVVTNTTKISGELSTYAPIKVQGVIVDSVNHVIYASKIFTINNTLAEESVNED
ncbi:MAG: hypothetical protein QW765_01395 [Fervidicoccaceae archaeon]